MSIQDLYIDMSSMKSSGSGTGGSFYSLGGICGMKSRLKEMFPFEESDEPYEVGQTTKTGRRKANGMRAGTFFHEFQRRWRTGSDTFNYLVPTEHADYDFELAINSFVNYRRHYKNNPHNRGHVINAEVKYPTSEEQLAAVKAILGDAPFTIRYDLLVDISEADRERIAIEEGLALPSAGKYLVDYKLVSSIGDNTVSGYTSSFQSLSYPLVYNICNPDAPVVGMLYDITARVQKPEPRHFVLALAEANDKARHIVESGVSLAVDQHKAGRANPFACDGKFGLCHFAKAKVCPQYGSFEQHLVRFQDLKG